MFARALRAEIWGGREGGREGEGGRGERKGGRKGEGDGEGRRVREGVSKGARKEEGEREREHVNIRERAPGKGGEERKTLYQLTCIFRTALYCCSRDTMSSMT